VRPIKQNAFRLPSGFEIKVGFVGDDVIVSPWPGEGGRSLCIQEETSLVTPAPAKNYSFGKKANVMKMSGLVGSTMGSQRDWRTESIN
jgi:hypothetical protein